MTIRKSKVNIYQLLLVLVIVLAVFLRFYRVEETFSIIFDTARDLEAVRKIIVDKKLTLLGPHTSVGLWSVRETYFGPLHYYLILPPLILFKMDPIGPVIFTGITNLASGFVLFLLLRDLLKNKWLSLMFFVLYLLSPIAVQYSRFFWNPNFLPLFVSLTLWLFWLFIKSGKKIFIWLVGLAAGLSFQLHYITLSIFLVIISMPLVFLKERRRLMSKFVYSFYSFSGFLFGILPIILFELRHKLFLTGSVIFHLFSGKDVDFHFPPSLAWLYFRSMIGRFLGMTDYSLISMVDRYSWMDLIYSIISLLLFSSIFFLKRFLKEKEKIFAVSLMLVIFLGIVSGVLWSTAGKSRIEDRYFLPLIIPYFVLLAFSVDLILKIVEQKRKFCLLVSCLTAMALFLSLKKDFFIINERIGIDEYHVNFSGAKTISSIISKDVNENRLEGKFNVANIIDGNTRATYYRYFLELNQTPAMAVEQYPQAEVLYVLSKNEADFVINYPVWEISSFTPREIVDQWQGPYGVKIFKLEKGE